MSEAQIVEPTHVEQPPVKDAAPPLNPDPPAPEPVAEEGDDVIEIPTGEKLVTLTALTNARAKTKELKDKVAELEATAGQSAAKDAQLAALQQQLEQAMPLAQAYQAAVEAQRNQPPAKQEPTPAEMAKFEKVAKQLDFYKTDGTLDLDRAKSHMELIREEAAEIARASVQPIHQQNISQQSSLMYQRALITKGADGAQPDPEILRTYWGRVDPNLTATPEGAAQIWNAALGATYAIGKAPKKQDPIPDPLLVEKAGGRDVEAGITMTPADSRLARELGMTDKEYQAEVGKMPKGWGK